MDAVATIRPGPYDWLHFASRSGEAGRVWATEYRRHTPTVELSLLALEQLRRRDLAEGHTTLRKLARALANMDGVPTSMRRVLDRWYHGTAAYYFYCIEEFDRAERFMALAHDSVVEAISSADFLIMLAVHCQEFCLHQARIARNRRRWSDMRNHVEHARAMMLDRAPLCELRDGRPIFFSTLDRFFHSLKPLSPEERESIAGLVDERSRILLFDRFVRRLYSLPGFAISYP